MRGRRPHAPLLAVALAVSAALVACSSSPPRAFSGDELLGVELTVVSGPADHERLLGQLAVSALRATGARVADRTGEAGTEVRWALLAAGEADVGWDDTAAAWTVRLRRPWEGRGGGALAAALGEVEDGPLVWLPASGLEDPWTVVEPLPASSTTTAPRPGAEGTPPGPPRRLTAAREAGAVLCVGRSFASRADGLAHLDAALGGWPRDALVVEPGERGDAGLLEGRCELAQTTALDVRLAAGTFRELPGYPPGAPAVVLPVVHAGALADHPAVADVLDRLTTRLDRGAFDPLAAAVAAGADPARVAAEWIDAQRADTPAAGRYSGTARTGSGARAASAELVELPDALGQPPDDRPGDVGRGLDAPVEVIGAEHE